MFDFVLAFLMPWWTTVNSSSVNGGDGSFHTAQNTRPNTYTIKKDNLDDINFKGKEDDLGGGLFRHKLAAPLMA
nr:hypothetical protein Iba_chr01aCG8000 [Ipomoea batatas]